MKICDLTQFYSPLSGGVKRYVQEKISYIETSRLDDEHVLVIPGAKTECIAAEQSRTYTIHSPIISKATQYRVLLNLRAIRQIIERERPDIIESADPYQVGWQALRVGRMYQIPVVAFYHSHFVEAYLRGLANCLGARPAKFLLRAGHAYVRKLYNQFEATLVPSLELSEVLTAWGVVNTRAVELGVNTGVFHPRAGDARTRANLGISDDRTLLLYVGRLAQEKNTQTLFEAFTLLAQRRPADFHLLVIGDGQQQKELRKLVEASAPVSWIRYCTDAQQLARYYCAANLFVHPGIEETFGLVALESQACGTPVVGIRGSYMDKVIMHDQNSWAAENNAEALAGAIERMAAQDLAGMGAAASLVVAERYAWSQVFKRLFGIYREVCAGYRRASPG